MKWYADAVFHRLLLLACLLGALVLAAPVSGSAAAQPHAVRGIVLDSIGKGAVDLHGAWRFHEGDNPNWCKPGFPDEGWEVLRADESWGAQGHPAYTGLAWYRIHIAIEPSRGDPGRLRILIPSAEDAYEVYWNCQLVGGYGSLPPNASWYYSQFPRSFPLNGNSSGELAIRFWKAPLEVFSSDTLGGLYSPPILGNPEVVQLLEDSITWQLIRAQLFDYSLVLLRVFITVFCILLWRRIRQSLFAWVAVFTSTPVALGMLGQLFLIPISYPLARFFNQPLYMLYSVSLWFLLLFLLELQDHARIRRLTRLLVWLGMALAFGDGLLALFWAHAGPAMQWGNAILVTCMLLLQTYPFVLVAVGMRRKHDISRWAVVIGAVTLKAFDSVAAFSALGERFTHWTLYTRLVDAPMFTIQGVQFTAEKVTSLLLFAAILFAMFRYLMEQQARRNALENEIQSAREIQQVLMPETAPAIEGFAISSAYVPAQEVGGDFFQILPASGGASIIALGDVSGKGLKAAMSVSMLVGALRAEAAITSSPAAVLEGLNRCMAGRMNGGFATALVFRIEPDGTLVLSNAGHLPPYLNGQEFPLDPTLPLGIVADSSYSEITLHLNAADEMLFYTDGLVESQDEAGQMFGFDRLRVLLALRPTAQDATRRAVEFGQQDDITVLTLTRLAAGQEASTSVTVPVFHEMAEG